VGRSNPFRPQASANACDRTTSSSRSQADDFHILRTHASGERPQPQSVLPTAGRATHVVLELVCDTAAALAAWKRPQQRRAPTRRLDVRQEQAELMDALRAANPTRWTDAAVAKVLGIDLAAIEALKTSTEDCLPCEVA
jgi:hypothetical protein